MRLHEAIEKAGAGGKIYRDGIEGYLTIQETGRPKMPNGQNWHPYVKDLIANDWEVVTPEIQVGDIVEHKGIHCSQTGEVLLISLEHEMALIKTGDTSWQGSDLKDLIFISRPEKPEKIVSVSVRFIKVDGYIVPVETTTAYLKLAYNGKRYTMTLTEEK